MLYILFFKGAIKLRGRYFSKAISIQIVKGNSIKM